MQRKEDEKKREREKERKEKKRQKEESNSKSKNGHIAILTEFEKELGNSAELLISSKANPRSLQNLENPGREIGSGNNRAIFINSHPKQAGKTQALG